MSSGNVVDSKVVELGFNNQQFESNAKTSISTLDKLKNALNFSGSSKNFEDMNKSLGKIDVKSLSAGVGTLRDSLNSLRNIVVFSWIADEAIKAKNAVEGFLKSVTTQQVAAGWDKYAEKTSAVQTIMAATAKDFSDQGEQMEYVNAQLEKLNWFTDETSYNFLDMVNNIGKFTANNVSLDQAVTSMQGISNWAAISGANVNEAGRAMYNLSQAIAVGSVKLMDWKSIENANMATAEFKQTAIETAESMNMLTKASDDTWKTLAGHEVSVTNFNQALSDGWFTSEVLLQTLGNYGAFTNQLYESLEKMSDDFLTSDLLDLIEDYKSGSIDMNEAVKETGLSAKELTEELDKLSSEQMEFGLKAFKAAQEAKTFQEAVDAVKDAASTGWMNTFEIMFGDYLQAKELWTTLANDLYDIFAEGGNARNDLLKEAFGTQTAVTQADFDLLTKSGIASPAFKAAVRRSAQEHGVVMAKLVSDEEWFQTVLERGELTMEDLNNAYKEVYGSSLADVDQALMDQVKTAAETDESFKSLLDTVDKYNAEQLKEIKFGDGEYTEGLEELEGSLDEIIKSLGLTQEEGQALVDVLIAMKNGGKVTAAQLNEMTDSEIEALGFSEEVTEQLKELKAQGKLTDEAIMDIINNQHKTGGQLWTESLYNGMEAIMNIVEVVRESFHDIFPPTDSGTLFEFLQWLNKATASFAEGVKTSEPFKAALHGIFSAVDLLLRALGAVAKIAKNAFTSVLDVFGINIGSIVEKAGNAVTNFRNWAVENEAFSKTVTVVSNAISGALKWVKGLIDQFMSLPIVSKNLARFRAGFRLAFHSMPAFMKGLGEHFQKFKDRVKELGGLKLGNLPKIFGAFKEEILDYFTNFTGFKGIKSAFSHLGKDMLGGLGALKDKLKGALGSVKDYIVEALSNWRGTLDDNSLVAKIYDFLSGALGKVTGMLSDVAKNGDKSIFGKVFDVIIKGVTGLFGIISRMPWGKIAGTAVIVTPIVLVVKAVKKIWDLLKFILHPIESISEVVDNVKSITKSIKDKLRGENDTFGKIIKAIKAATLLILAIAAALYIISAIPADRMDDSIIALMGMMAFVAIFIAALAVIDDLTRNKKTGRGGITKDMSKAIISSAIAMFIMAMALSKISKIPADRLRDSVLALGAIALILSVMQVVNGLLNKFKASPKGAGKAMLASAIAIFIVAEALAQIAKIDPDRLEDAVVALAIIGILLVAMQAILGIVSMLGGKTGAGQIFGMIASAIALSIMADTLSKLAKIKPAKLKSAVKALAVLAIVLVGIQAVLGIISGLGGGTGAGQIFGMIASAIALFMMAEALAKVATIPSDRLDCAVNAMAMMGIILAGMQAVMGMINAFDGNVSFGQNLALVATAKALDMMAGTMAKLADIPTDKLDDAELAISILSGLLAGMETVLGLLNKFEADLSGWQILGLAVAAGSLWVLADALQKLSTIPEENLTNASIAISIMGGLITGMETILGIVNMMGANISGWQILALAVAAGSIWVMADAMTKLAAVPKEDLIKAGIAIGAIVVCLGVVIGLLALAGLAAGLIGAGLGILGAVAGVIILIGVVGGILGGLVSLIPEGIREGILSGIEFIGQMLYKIGEALAQILVGTVLGAASMLPELGTYIKQFTENMEGVKPIDLAGLAAFGEAILIIGAIEFVGFFESIASFVREAQTGRSNTEQFGLDLQALAEGLQKWQAAMEEIDKIKIPTGGLAGLIVAVAAIDFFGFFEAIGDAWSTLLTGNSTMENFVEDIGLLSKALVDWKTAMEGIDEIKVPSRGIRELNDVVFEINFAGFFEAVGDVWSKWLTGNTTMENFVDDITRLSKGLTDWQTVMEGIEEINVPTDGINTLAGTVSDINFEGFFSAIDIAFSEWLTDKTPMENFVQGIGELAKGLGDWKTKMEEIGHVDVPTNTIDDLVKSLDKITFSDLKATVVEWLKQLTGGEGEDPITTFGEKIEGLATALGTWKEKMDEIGTVSVPKTAIDNLVEALKEIPKKGGLLDAVTKFFTGDEDFTVFEEKIKGLGQALKTFSDTIGEDFNVDIVDSASNTVSAFAALFEGLKGHRYADAPDMIIASLGKGIAGLGEKLQEFTAVDIDLEKFTAMSSATESLAHAAEVMAGFELTGDIVDEGKIASFKTGIETLKTSIESLKDLDTSGVEKLKNATTDLSTVDVSSVTNNLGESAASGASGASMHSEGAALGTSFANGILSGKDSASGAASTIASAAKGALSDLSLRSEGAALGTSFANGILSGKDSAFSAASSVASSAKSGMSGISMHSVGSDFTTGFANGILSGKASAMASAAAVASAAMQAVKDAINSHSPSKETYKLGDFFGQGFTLGIDDNITSSYRSGRAIGNAAKNGLKDAAKSIKDVLESDLDAQPVVRPVLDLSEIQNGAGSISDLLSTSPIGITGNLSAINRNVNGRSMTTNDDVVSAISQLRRTLNDNIGPRNTYNVNGVTYDDGSNISEAVGSLVRAIRVERRA